MRTKFFPYNCRGETSLADNNESKTKVEQSTSTAPGGAATSDSQHEESADDGLLSLENLDQVLADEDPEFSKGLVEIGPDDPSAMYIYDPDLELPPTLEDEIRSWENSTGVRKFLYKIFPFLPKFLFTIKNFKTFYRETKEKLREKAIYLRKEGVRDVLAWIKGKKTKITSAIAAKVSALITTFKSFSLVKKLIFVALILVTGAATGLIYRIATKGLVGKSESLFMTSMGAWGQKSYTYDPSTEVEPFYDSLRASQNMLSLEKMIVNLRPSETSGPNPMGAFEFFVEGMAADVIVEIKDREPEMRDLFQRTIEESTFDFVASGEGKQQLCDKLRKEVNKVLTTGRVRRIFIKTAIIKP